MENRDRITPIDIEHVQFDTTFKGYNEKQVDEFLDKLTADYEDVVRENALLKKEIEKIKEESGKIQQMEEKIKTTMFEARKASENLKEESQKEIQELKRKKDAFILEFKNMLITTIDYLEKMENKLDKIAEDNLGAEN